MVDSPQNAAPQGPHIKRYHLEQFLGAGVVGQAYKSVHPDLQQYVVVKILHPQYAQTTRFQRFFIRDLAEAITLSHPFMVPILDYGMSDDERYYLVTEYKNGLSLADYLDQKISPLTPVRAFHLLAPIANALQYLHVQKLTHGNIKPTNILIDERENSFLADYGVAKFANVAFHPTKDGQMAALSYKAPEQTNASTTELAADIYGLGAVLYVMLTQQRPSSSTESSASLIPPTQHHPDIPQVIERVVTKAMAVEPGDRFADAESMMVAFRYALARAEDDESKASIRFPSTLEAFSTVHIGDYKIIRLLTQENNHIYQSYLATASATNQKVTLTVLRTTVQEHPQIIDRFGERIKKIQSLNHPGIAVITQTGISQDKRPYAACEFISGRTLSDMLPTWTNASSSLSPKQALSFIREVAAILEAAHQAGLIHYELNPQNIILKTAANQPVLIRLEIPVPPLIDPAFSNPNDPGYEPPEQYNSAAITIQSNIYSLGVMLYQLLTGHRPIMPLWQLATFSAEDIPQAIPLSPDQEQFTPETQQIFEKSLISEETDRFVTISAFIQQIDQAIVAEEMFRPLPAPDNPSIPTESIQQHKRSLLPRNAAPVLVLALLLLIILTIFFFWQQQRPLPTSSGRPTVNSASTFTSSATTFSAALIEVEDTTATATLPSTATSTQTSTPSATPAATMTSTIRPSQTATAAPATATATPLPTAVALLPASIFLQPDSNSTELSRALVGEDVTILGRSSAGQWFFVRNQDNVTGYIHQSRLEWDGDFDTLPIIEATAVPQPS